MPKKKTSLLPIPVEKQLSEMERFFEHAFSSPFFSSWRFPSLPDVSDLWKESSLRWPKVDIKETKTQYKITADVPGVNPDDVHVEVEGNQLIIRGKSEEEKEQKDEKVHRVERHSGSFYRSMTLPENAQADKISASHKNGTLQIVIPKRTQKSSSKKEIPVKKK